ncbi:MAG TPA: antibiotic biosynthesis monooxygenase [Sediminibacterium sp.]|jgi:4-carboxymuconolactone decarboxylase|nr:antibiotic biosynthesis monooxygenase [Sediminibacterium sp.]
MKQVNAFFKSILLVFIMLLAHQNTNAQSKETITRLAVLEIDSAYLTEYKSFLKEGVEQALKKEPGVLTIYPMAEVLRPTHFTILEVYASKAAYELHLKTPHFLKYKNGTLHMVKSLQLINVYPLTPQFTIHQKRKE